MENKNIIIIGSGGHAKVVIEALKSKYIQPMGIISNEITKGNKFCGIDVLGSDEELIKLEPEKYLLVNGIGHIPEKNNRLNVSKAIEQKKFNLYSVIHKETIISESAKLENGVQVMAGAIIQAGVAVGRNCIINTGVILEHDCEIGENTHLASGSICCGNVTIGDNTFIGSGSTIIHGVSIGSNCIIAAGSTVYKDIKDNNKLIQKI